MENRSQDFVTPGFVNTDYRTSSSGVLRFNGIDAPRDTTGIYVLSDRPTVGYINSSSDTDIYFVPDGYGTPARNYFNDPNFAARDQRVYYIAIEEAESDGVYVDSGYAFTDRYRDEFLNEITRIYKFNEQGRSYSDPNEDRRAELSRPDDGIYISSEVTGVGEDWVYLSGAPVSGGGPTIRKYAIGETPDEALTALRSGEPTALQSAPGSAPTAGPTPTTPTPTIPAAPSTGITDTGTPYFQTDIAGVQTVYTPAPYSGPVAGIDWQYLGSSAASETISGTFQSDFINGLAGSDVIFGNAGNDILDGGTGSNYLVGGQGADTFFTDARDGQVGWTTIADFVPGVEQVSIFGFKPGISRVFWEENYGAEGSKGATAFFDMDGSSQTDRSGVDFAVTFSGHSVSDLGPSYQLDGLLWFRPAV